MDATLISVIASASGVIVTALSGYFVARRNARKDLQVNDRQLLSQDEKEFRSTILEENQRLRAKVEELTELVGKLQVENSSLTIRLMKLEGSNIGEDMDEKT